MVSGCVQLAGPPARFFDTADGEATPPTLDGAGAPVRAWLAGTGWR